MRKDYRTVAECIRYQAFEVPGTLWTTAYAIANALAVEFELDNPRFDRERFMTACGFES